MTGWGLGNFSSLVFYESTFPDNEAGDAYAEELFKNVDLSLVMMDCDVITLEDTSDEPGAVTIAQKPVVLG